MTKDFRLHAFVCTNQRDPKKPRECCAAKNSLDVMTRLKRAAKSAGIKDVRVNKSGCLDKCEQGISCVVYPDGIWYTCLLYTSPSPRDGLLSRMPSSA